MVITEDGDIFFNDQEFATPAWIEGQQVMGFVSQSWVTDQEVELPRTTFTCPSRAVLAISSGEVVTLSEAQVPYRVVRLHPDGSGLTVLTLEKA